VLSFFATSIRVFDELKLGIKLTSVISNCGLLFVRFHAVIIDSKVSSVGFKATLFSDDDKYSWSESSA
jgi:hypothetical protein